MSINFFWMKSSNAIPTQLTAAIYQAAIGVVYVIAVLLMGEKLELQKALGVVTVMCGVFLSSFYPPISAVATGVTAVDASHDYTWGCIFAFLALGSKVASQIFTKIELQGASITGIVNNAYQFENLNYR